ncbi:hypothetical protein FFWV33_09425 [Flavobacterium faecale]|uniref:Uncharacterized protein n=1 Tax=Flavobacterium faecale TaxID=1355330 RepID=A0A2S1LDD4_9FLAO|nr:hypothetical protein [Flavobacterium faecale]AWG21744.1 hypothetical protein FFWV33_09425 [Flavobacterium faecale]
MENSRQKKIYLKKTTEISLLEKKSEFSITNIFPLRHINLMDREIYFNRVYENQKKGKIELRKMLDEVRKITFSKDELINWFYKIKDDSVNEVEHLMIRHEATMFAETKDIDFERIGFLTGIYEEAEKFLSIMVAIEPIDEKSPHYSILDELEEIDEKFIESDDIPGYYNVQRHSKIKLRKFQIKDLKSDWNDELDRNKDSEYVSEDFGNITHLMSRYHTEFTWEIYRIKPRGDIKSYLDFHYNSFKKDKVIFVNHIEFRILPQLENFTRTNHKLYEQLIYEWLNEKKEKLNNEEKEFLLTSVISVCTTFLDNIFEYKKSKSENKYNIILRDFLKHRINNRQWTIKDQSMGGTTDPIIESNTSGIAFRDLIIENELGNHISAIECLRIKSIPKDETSDKIIKEHLVKIFRNEPIGISPLFIITYCETKNFEDTWEKYLNYIVQIDFGKYQHLDLEKNIGFNDFANLKIAKMKHYRSLKNIEVYHLFINMNP